MLMGDQNSGQVLGSSAKGEHPLADLPAAQAGVHEEARLVRLKIGAIATGTTAQNRQLHSHAPTLEALAKMSNEFSSKRADNSIVTRNAARCRRARQKINWKNLASDFKKQ